MLLSNTFSQAICLAAFDGSRMVQGSVNEELLPKIIRELNRVSNEAIYFDVNRVVVELGPEPTTRGVCSVIALKVAKVALKRGVDGVSDYLNSEFMDQLTLHTSLEFKLQREKKRTIQAAFNTFAVNKELTLSCDEIGREKIQAIANYFNLNVLFSTESKRLDAFTEETFCEMVKNLSDGVYLLRIIQEEKGEPGPKCEVHGHSICLIKEGQRLVEFDTQIGMFDISKSPAVLYRSLITTDQRFQVDTVQFHLLELSPTKIFSRPKTQPITFSIQQAKQKPPRIFFTKTGALSGRLHIPEYADGIVIVVPGSGVRYNQKGSMRLEALMQERGNLGTVVFDLMPNKKERKLELNGNIPRLVEDPLYFTRLVERTKEITVQIAEEYPELPIMYLGISTGAAIALSAASELPDVVKSVATRGGRPDLLSKETLLKLSMPVSFIVGSEDATPLAACAEAHRIMETTAKFTVVEGADHGFAAEDALQEAVDAALTFFEEFQT